MTSILLPPYVPHSLVAARLPLIFPSGIPQRTFCTRELAASTVFTLLYIGAVDGNDTFAAPKHVYRMTEEQSQLKSNQSRIAYWHNAIRPGSHVKGKRWYADNTRESIRDETLREGLLQLGAAISKSDIPTTSSKPRYALASSFASLFDPTLNQKALQAAIAEWQQRHLSAGAQARISLIRAGLADSNLNTLVEFPNKETRALLPGPSSIISKAVIEQFAPRFLNRPAVLWLSESGNKVVARDDKLANAIGIEIDSQRDLPDIILVDLGPSEPILVFVEVVATDGPMTVRRKEALLTVTDAAKFARSQVMFVTAYVDRDSPAIKKNIGVIAENSFIWFASEPGVLVALISRHGLKLNSLPMG